MRKGEEVKMRKGEEVKMRMGEEVKKADCINLGPKHVTPTLE